MNTDGGWIKIHRQVSENPVVMKDADHMALWFYLLLKVAYEPRDVFFKGERLKLRPGQLTTGRKELAAKLKVSESKIERILKCFESEQQIEQQTTSVCRLITVKNWERYQKIEQPNEQRVNNERTTSEQRVNTNKELKNIRIKELEIESEQIVLDEPAKPPTPAQVAKSFFSDISKQAEEITRLVENGWLPVMATAQITGFVEYWTEPTPDGKHVRWQKEKVFELERRIKRWLGNHKEKSSSFQTNNRPQGTQPYANISQEREEIRKRKEQEFYDKNGFFPAV